jgi:hypothetical protein
MRRFFDTTHVKYCHESACCDPQDMISLSTRYHNLTYPVFFTLVYVNLCVFCILQWRKLNTCLYTILFILLTGILLQWIVDQLLWRSRLSECLYYLLDSFLLFLLCLFFIVTITYLVICVFFCLFYSSLCLLFL